MLPKNSITHFFENRCNLTVVHPVTIWCGFTQRHEYILITAPMTEMHQQLARAYGASIASTETARAIGHAMILCFRLDPSPGSFSLFPGDPLSSASTNGGQRPSAATRVTPHLGYNWLEVRYNDQSLNDYQSLNETGCDKKHNHFAVINAPARRKHPVFPHHDWLLTRGYNY